MEEGKLKELLAKQRITKDIIKNAVEEHKEYIKTNRYSMDKEILREIILSKAAVLNSNEVTPRLKAIYEISTLINAFYSTRMGNDRVWEVSKKINNNYIMPKNYNKENVIKFIDSYAKEIALYIEVEEQKSEYYTNFGAYSFLTKYFAITDRFLNQEGNFSTFPIYDSLVETELKKEIGIKRIDLKKYEKLYNTMRQIKQIIGNDITFSDLDNYFWLQGKKKNDNLIQSVISKMKKAPNIKKEDLTAEERKYYHRIKNAIQNQKKNKN